jgi:hypothetical protein
VGSHHSSDDAELVAEFRRHGVQPGQRIHVAIVPDSGEPEPRETQPSFFESFGGPADLGERSGPPPTSGKTVEEPQQS